MDATAMPALSVIIPAHNASRHLATCLQALQTSTFRDFEVLVVDDNSDDETQAIASKHGARVSRLPDRRGPAAARNVGAEHARGEVLCFIDADVAVHPNALGQIHRAFRDEPVLDALFGSYDDQPAARSIVSQFRNLLHHFVHQTANPRASTFWAGCGAVRRSAFRASGGFCTSFTTPKVEDIEFGMRLVRSGHSIAVKKDIQATHLKQWSPLRLLRTDICDRAIPWTLLILRERTLSDDLNLKVSQRASVVAAYGLLGASLGSAAMHPPICFVIVAWLLSVAVSDRWTERGGNWTGWRQTGLAGMLGVTVALLVSSAGVAGWISGGLLAAIVVLNLDFYRLLVRKRGGLFAMLASGYHVAYFLCSGAGFGIGSAVHYSRRLALSGSSEPGRAAPARG